MTRAEIPSDKEGEQYHLRIKPGDVSKYVLLPGDRGRVPQIASLWDKYWLISQHREYVTYSGYYKGVFITATSTGIGAPSTAIAIEELARCGANTFIRVGTTGALRKDIYIGDLVISTGSVRLDGTSKQYVWPEYPALASYEIVLALIDAAESYGFKYHVGITASSDSFYVGQERPGFNNYIPPFQRGLVRYLREINVLNFEMETSIIFTLTNIYGLRAGAVCAVIANRETGEFVENADVENAIKVGNEAIKILSEWDMEVAVRKRRYITPDIIRSIGRK
ncbi:MAG: uridine phosphorylase [Desulfurococcaceae archaeon]